MRKLRIFLEMIKFEHTVFALPFAYLGAFLAAGGSPTAAQLFWITLAMLGARTAAMSLNRLIDQGLDALNPRTAMRALPRGLLSGGEVLAYALASLLLLFYAAYRLNPLCVRLLPVAVAMLTVYSYTKRWTWACHFVLGATDGLAPLGGWVAITGRLDLPGLVLGITVALWVAGFDLIYACQDYEFDRAHGVLSVPSRFGIPVAFWTSRILHLLAILGLAYAGILLGRGGWYLAGVLGAAALLLYEHLLVKPSDLSRLGVAFLNVNGYLSLMVFVFVMLDLFL